MEPPLPLGRQHKIALPPVCLTLPLAYLAPISHYQALRHRKEATLEVCDTYERQTLRNRCYIAAANGCTALTVPVVAPEGERPLMRDVRISDHGNWRHLHWQAIVSAYRATPFFEFYADDFAPFYARKWHFLADYNEELMRLVCRLLGLRTELSRTTSFAGTPAFPLKRNANERHGEGREYYQVFGKKHGFIGDLSIIDLLFNMGPEAILWL